MKILRSLNNIFLIVLFCILGLSSYAEDKPVDIWNIDEKDLEENSISNDPTEDSNTQIKSISEFEIYKSQSQKQNDKIKLDQTINSKEIEIFGLYDPADYGLDINMWSNSDGDQLKNIFSKLDKIDLSNDASEIMKAAILTNAHYPKKNISEKEFLNFKRDWLIKNSDLDLIEEYLTKNQIFNLHPKLTGYLIDQYLLSGKADEPCKILSKNSKPIDDEYVSKFYIYCLIRLEKKDEAQVFLDLKKEVGFKNLYFEKKIDYLLGYTKKIDKTVSEKSIFEFHLAHQTNPDFNFEPKDTTDKRIWNYLSSWNLLNSFQEIETSEIDKISMIEKAVHNKNYPERDLFELYKRFQFNINQLLNAKDSFKSLSSVEARALIYQKILLESEMVDKLKYLKLLKDLFIKDKINNAFDIELKKYLNDMDPLRIPDNLTSFYYTNIEIKKDNNKKIKFNNEVLHQSKLVNYFKGNYSKKKIEKDVNNFLKKIKKDKKYFLSQKDIIFLESLKSDGIDIEKKYSDLYEVNDSEIPSDIKVMINNDEKGTALLRLVEIIGQDQLERIDDETLYFIITTLNQLNIDMIRNKILIKVLPLKV